MAVRADTHFVNAREVVRRAPAWTATAIRSHPKTDREMCSGLSYEPLDERVA
jgi:hypothetical protein